MLSCLYSRQYSTQHTQKKVAHRKLLHIHTPSAHKKFPSLLNVPNGRLRFIRTAFDASCGLRNAYTRADLLPIA